jgi:flagellar protein FlgJ
MSIESIGPNSHKASDQTARIKDAACQFEALLVGQMLKSVREADAKGLSGDSTDSSADSMMEMAEQQLSRVLAASGGLGLSKIIVQGLTPKQSQ